MQIKLAGQHKITILYRRPELVDIRGKLALHSVYVFITKEIMEYLL